MKMIKDRKTSRGQKNAWGRKLLGNQYFLYSPSQHVETYPTLRKYSK
jgi:hypothetical protein